jgi:hypothetical protein
MEFKDYYLDTDYATFVINYMKEVNKFESFHQDDEKFKSVVYSAALVGKETFDSLYSNMDMKISDQEKNTKVLSFNEVAQDEMKKFITALN